MIIKPINLPWLLISVSYQWVCFEISVSQNISWFESLDRSAYSQHNAQLKHCTVINLNVIFSTSTCLMKWNTIKNIKLINSESHNPWTYNHFKSSCNPLHSSWAATLDSNTKKPAKTKVALTANLLKLHMYQVNLCSNVCKVEWYAYILKGC